GVRASSSSDPDHFSCPVPSGAACGAALDFTLALSYDQGSNVTALPVIVGDPPGPPPTPVNEPFAGATPPGWTVVDGGTSGGVARTWTGANPCSRTIGPPLSGSWEMVDSNCAGSSATQNESLSTLSIDASGCLP